MAVEETDETGDRSSFDAQASDEPIKEATKGEFVKVDLGNDVKQVESVEKPQKSLDEPISESRKTSRSWSDKIVKSSAAVKEDAEPNGKATPKDVKSLQPGYIRHMIAILALSSIVLANMDRQVFNQALVSMVRKHKANQTVADSTEPASGMIDRGTQTNFSDYINTESYLDLDNREQIAAAVETLTQNPLLPSHDPSLTDKILVDVVAEELDTFSWEPWQISLLQSGFSYGYAPLMILGGRLSEIYGAKWVVFLSGFGSALCCALAPLLADSNFWFLFASRVAMGASQTGVSPALFALLTRWLPPDEACVYLPMIKVGVTVGLMGGSMISGFLPWRLSFYTTGFISVMWSCLWIFLVTSNPKDHRYLSQRELKYIEHGINEAKRNDKNSSNNKSNSAPWLGIILNPVVFALLITKFTSKMTVEAMNSQLPMYLGKVFNFSKELNGSIISANNAIQAIFTGFIAYLAKEFVTRRWFGLKKTGVRRLFQGICNFGIMISYILVTMNNGCVSVVLGALFLLSIASMFGAGGEAVLPADLSLEYSASIMAITNSAANLSGMVLPPLVSMILMGELDSHEKWNQIWLVTGAIAGVGGVAFCCVVNAELQDFSRSPCSSNESNQEAKDKPVTVIEMKPTTKGAKIDTNE